MNLTLSQVRKLIFAEDYLTDCSPSSYINNLIEITDEYFAYCFTPEDICIDYDIKMVKASMGGDFSCN